MDYDYLALLFSSTGERCASSLLDSLRHSGLANNCYAYKLRVKSKEDLIKKRFRKLKDKSGYCITDITDVVGIRLVTLFKSDMLSVFEKLLTHLRDGNGVRFANGAPEEIIVYLGSSVITDFAEEIREIANRNIPGCAVGSKNSDEGYSSIHVVARLEPPLTDAKLEGRAYHLPIEIQIRTVFEDAWGEIDHRYGYVVREGKDAGIPIENPEHVLKHLRVLKDFTDACMDYAECIKNEALPTRKVSVGAEKTISVESDDELLNRFIELGISIEFIERYKDARSMREEAEGLREAGSGDAYQVYLQAAELFRELGNSLVVAISIERMEIPDRLRFYYCRMNEALCLMSANKHDHIVAATAIYSLLEQHYQDFPLLKLRHGQAQGKLGRVDVAIDKIRASGELMRSYSIDDGNWSDALPKADYEHMLLVQPKLLGFFLWQKAELLPSENKEEKAALYLDAYNNTMLCLDAPVDSESTISSIYNNLVYYCIGYLFNAKDQSCSISEAIKLSLVQHLDRLMELLGNEESWSIEDHDTVFKAMALMGNENAKRLAGTLVTKCLQDTGDTPVELRMRLASTADVYMRTDELTL